MRRMRKRKLKLFSRSPFCHWCGIETIVWKPKRHARIPDNAATVDHLYTRFDWMKGKTEPGVEATVLSCNKCNFERGAARQLTEGIYELRRRSGRFPRIEVNSP